MPKIAALIAALGLACAAFAQDKPDDPKQAEKEAEARAKKTLDEFREKVKAAKSDDDTISALKGLGDEPHATILAELKKWLSKPSRDVRSQAAEEIGKFKKNDKAAAALLQAAHKDTDADFVWKCLDEVGNIGARAVAKDLVSFFEHNDLTVSKEAVAVGGELKSKNLVDPLIVLAAQLELDKERLEQARQAAAAGGQPPAGGNNNGPQLPSGAQQTHDEERAKRAQELLPCALDALKSITNENFASAQEWKAWWVKNKSSFKERD